MENEKDDRFNTAILSRLNSLEKHMINIMCAFQDFFKLKSNAFELLNNKELLNILSKPLQINERPFQELRDKIDKLNNLEGFFSRLSDIKDHIETTNHFIR